MPRTRRDPSGEVADGTRWLTESEKQAWTGFVALILLLPGHLEQALQPHGLTLFEYLTLSHISEAPERRLRLNELAFLAHGSPSRLSNVMKRLEARGLVSRSADPSNRRFTVAALTQDGYDLVVQAAPSHAQSVRDLVLDPLDETELSSLHTIAAKLGAIVPR